MHVHGVDSEIGRLRTVLVHRPGLELRRVTPRLRDRLLFETLPWACRAQQEHDAFAQAMRDRGVEVLYVTELLQDTLEYQHARQKAIAAAVADPLLGAELRDLVCQHLDALRPEELAQALIAGLAPEELPGGQGLVFQLLDRRDFVIEPLPNLVFTRDTSFWAGDRPAVASLAATQRRREAELLAVIYDHHPRFAGVKRLYGPGLEQLDGGDVLLLAPSVLAIGVGQRTTPAGAERLARRVLDAGLAHTVLAIPVDQRPGVGYLDTLCTVVDCGAVVMHPAIAYTLTAHLITARPEGTRVSRPQPFLEAAAQAIGIDRLTLIDTGMDPVSGRRGQWDDGGNALALGARLVMVHERHTETIKRLEGAGIEVVQVPGSELISARGGPRGMSCPVGRDPAAEGEREETTRDAEPGLIPRPERAAATSHDLDPDAVRDEARQPGQAGRAEPELAPA
jgi:arginine deiminase